MFVLLMAQEIIYFLITVLEELNTILGTNYLIGVTNQLCCCVCVKFIVEQPRAIADTVQLANTILICVVSLQSRSSCFEMCAVCDWQ